jgi:hypothetical protein
MQVQAVLGYTASSTTQGLFCFLTATWVPGSWYDLVCLINSFLQSWLVLSHHRNMMKCSRIVTVVLMMTRSRQGSVWVSKSNWPEKHTCKTKQNKLLCSRFIIVRVALYLASCLNFVLFSIVCIEDSTLTILGICFFYCCLTFCGGFLASSNDGDIFRTVYQTHISGLCSMIRGLFIL